MANYSEMMQLNYPQAGPSVLVMTVLAAIGLLAAVIMLIIILKYDTLVNQQTSLLTRTYNMTEVVLLIWVPSIILGYIIILTGASFNHYVCFGYTLLEYGMGYLYLQCTAMEAVIHYLFVVKSSRFLIIKDDLLCKIFWRSAAAVAIANTGRSFIELKQLPRTYHFCTGTSPKEYGPLEAKCDEDENQIEMATFTFYTIIFFSFTIAVCIENIRQRRSAADRHHPRRQLLVDNIGFIMKMTCTLLSCFATVAYDDMDIEYLVTFPGSLIYYFYHLWLHPVCSIVARMPRFWADRPLWAHVKRTLKFSSVVVWANK